MKVNISGAGGVEKEKRRSFPAQAGNLQSVTCARDIKRVNWALGDSPPARGMTDERRRTKWREGLLVSATIFLATSLLPAQSLFESATSGAAEKAQQAYELNGYVRGTWFGGKVPEMEEAETKSGYGELSTKIRVRKEAMGDAYAELRYRHGYEFGKEMSEFQLREGYVNAYLGRFDIRIGKQIVVWGRADGVNPTNNITPQNMLTRSPDEDDRREGNFIARGFFNADPLRIEGILVPVYRPSVLPLHLADLPAGITIADPLYPDGNFENCGYAARINLELPKFDGSLSYFNGYNPLPGFDMNLGLAAQMILTPAAYRLHVTGFDFSTTLGSTGLRGEAAFRYPFRDYEKHIHVPNPDLQYVVGVDREFGEVSIVAQYLGKRVMDYRELDAPVFPSRGDVPGMLQYQMQFADYQSRAQNRMFSAQQDEVSHSLFTRAAWKLMHETLILELAGMYNFTTEEAMVRPKVAYDIADALEIVAGGDVYLGPEGTLFDLVEEKISAGFVELKASF